jgi:hypothetical protein
VYDLATARAMANDIINPGGQQAWHRINDFVWDHFRPSNPNASSGQVLALAALKHLQARAGRKESP